VNRADRRATGTQPDPLFCQVAVGLIHRADSTKPQMHKSFRELLQRDAALHRWVMGVFDRESSANVAHGRCAIVQDFLAHPRKPQWLLLIDDDMTFGADLLDKLLAAADPKERPLVGGLCFGVRPVKGPDGREHFNECGGSPLELFPTIYVLDDERKMHHVVGYPLDSVIAAHSTGAACLLIHRSVLADERWKADGHPLPWFRESVMDGTPVSEDQFFCLKAGALGYPLHIHTGARTGHVKVFIADEDLFLAQRSALAEPVAS